MWSLVKIFFFFICCTLSFTALATKYMQAHRTSINTASPSASFLIPSTCVVLCRWKWVGTKVFVAFLEPSKSKWRFQQAYSGSGSRSKGSSALLTTQARRSLKDYTAACQRGVQSSGLRNQRIIVQGLGVSCPTRDKTATRYINHRGGCVHATSAEMQGHPRHFIYSTSSWDGSSSQVVRTTWE